MDHITSFNHSANPENPKSGLKNENVPPSDDLPSLDLLEYLDVEDRPIFMLDLKSLTKCQPVYCNASLRKIPLLEVRIEKGTVGTNNARDPAHSAFLDWATSSHRDDLSLERQYCGLRWSVKTLRRRWRLISAEFVATENVDPFRRSSEISRIGRSNTTRPERVERPYPVKRESGSRDTIESQVTAFEYQREEVFQGFPSVGGVRHSPVSPFNSADFIEAQKTCTFLDFTRPDPADMVLSPFLKFVQDFDWASTDLGPMSNWGFDLRRMVNLLMRDPRPAALYWGQLRTIIYNEPYVWVTGKRHPRMMGKRFVDAWEEISDQFLPLFDQAEEIGASFVSDHSRFDIERDGYLEETYYCISIIPFHLGDGGICFYNPALETTKQVITDRRMAFLLQMGQNITSSREPKYFWRQLLLGLGVNEFDLPFAMVYSAGEDFLENISISSEHSHNLREWVLEGVVRCDPQPAIPSKLGNETATELFVPGFTEMIRADSPTLLEKENGTLPTFMQEIPVFNDLRCDSAIFLPIRSTGDNVLGFLIIGVNPRKKYDDDYRVFIELFSRQLSTAMASAVLFEDELRRGRLLAEQANQDKTLLSLRLELQEHEAMESENRFHKMADLAPVGMFWMDPAGKLIYANHYYYKIIGCSPSGDNTVNWYDMLAKADRQIMDAEWIKVLAGEAISVELRLERPFVAEKQLVSGVEVEGSTWIIASAYPEKDQEGNVVGVLGCFTDISRQKWMENFQTRKMLEAVELKRQQENFIDLTSHEIRNPLSAIVQSSDWISSSLEEYGGELHDITVPKEMVDGIADAAQTIILCALHQKRIIDDMLDSDLLLITPIEVRPVDVIQNALRIFDRELHKSDMEMRFVINESYTELGVNWAMLDPSRLVQVLINLTTNAIKFTRTEIQKKISISIGASKEPPAARNGLEYLARSSSRKDMSLGDTWGTGEVIYLYVEVHDTGRGLSDNERTLLFNRFRQASPRTHVQYGGSGLGLFISRELTELQGGQIGVLSKAGVGSTFAFYVRARRCHSPKHNTNANVHTSNSSQLTTHSPGTDSQFQIYPDPKADPTATKSAAAKHILIVEDNLVNQKVLSKQLKSAGCIVSVANHGEEALAIIANSKFWKGCETTGQALDLVLMDLEMPVMDGLTCVKRIRELQQDGTIIRHIPVIAVTANARSQQIAVAKECGMDSVVTKPFRIPELLPEMERQVKRGRDRPLEVG